MGRPLPDLAAFTARATRRLRLFPATSSPVVRHPLLLASGEWPEFRRHVLEVLRQPLEDDFTQKR